MRASLWVVLLAAVVTASCGPTVDLTKGLQVVDVPHRVVGRRHCRRQNKLVPSVTFKFKNISDQTLNILRRTSCSGESRRTRSGESSFVKITGSEGLAPGATSESQTVKSQLVHRI